jgi:REP element-mobilizing transposase RayT/DNA-binding NarL/FixJ family response regulator
MTVSILVATPHAAFGELLRVSLVDSGHYQVDLVQTAKDARLSSEHTAFHLVILDSALSDEPFISLYMEILEQQPGVRIVIIPPENNPNHPALGGLIPHAYLSRPFYLPDLIETVSRLLADRERQFKAQTLAKVDPVPSAGITDTIPPWLQEPLTLHNYLEKELSGTQAIAAIAGLFDPIPGSGGMGAIRASAGGLNDEAAQELLEIIFRYWNHAEKTDLMRFVRLNADKKDYLVYATHIVGELVLIQVYDTSAPLSQIRPQTKAMAQALASTPPEGYRAEQTDEAGITLDSAGTGEMDSKPEIDRSIGEFSEPSHADLPATRGFNEPDTQPLNDEMFVNRIFGSSAAHENSAPDLQSFEDLTTQSETQEPAEHPATPGASESLNDFMQDEDDDISESGVINLTALLGSVPPPNPENNERRKNIFADWFPERSASNPIPTLSGGLNGGPSANIGSGLKRERSDEEEVSDPEDDQNNPLSNPSTLYENEWLMDQPPKKKAARTAPLDPQTIPRDSLPADPALPVDYTLPESDVTINIEEADFLKAVSGRPASLEVKTEPPVSPPGIPAAIEPLPAGSTPPEVIPAPEQKINPLEDTNPHVVSAISSLGQLEPASPALSMLNYTCVLVPRLPQHYLTGELADRMAVWVQQLCLAFGWRLEGISIRPEYLQWTVQVVPAISPGNLVRIIRQRTSLHIFGHYPHLGEQNPSGDFWANGYLIVSGIQPPSAQLLRDYISQTRKRQGVGK